MTERCTDIETVTSSRVRCARSSRHKTRHHGIENGVDVWWPCPPCTCETFDNGVVSGNDGRLPPEEGCPRHGPPTSD